MDDRSALRARIVVEPVWAFLDAPIPAILTAVSDALTVDDPAAEHSRAYQYGKWDGKRRFMAPGDNAFLAGFVWRARAAIMAAGFEAPEIVWPDRSLGAPFFEMLDIELRDYQKAAAYKALRAGRVALQCPTASGKTEIGIEITRQVGQPTLWITHSAALATETRARWIARTGLTPGLAQGPSPNWPTETPIVIGMIQSLARHAIPTLHRPGKKSIPHPAFRPDYFRRFKLVIVDEAHHAGAESYQHVLRACENASRRVGLSGTMTTSSIVADYRIEGALGPTHVVTTTAALVQAGFVARPRVTLLEPSDASYPSYEDIRDYVCPSWAANPRQLKDLGPALYTETYQRGIIENSERNGMIFGVAHRHAIDGDKFLVLVNRIPHAAALKTLWPRSAYPVYMLSGSDDDDTRDRVLAAFRSADRGAVLIATPFFREGLDIPQIDAGMLAGGGESDIAVWQALSRMLRKRPGKDFVEIYDFRDGPRSNRHDKDYLANHFDSRLDLFRRMGCDIVKG